MKTKNFVATDVGGTFTDLVQFCSDDSGRQVIKTAKSDTTPPSFEKGVLNVLDKAAIDISDIDLMSHGTTVVINALTERKGDKTALITTTGFRDVLEIGRGNRPDFFNLNFKKPEPFIPRAHRYEITERINHFGEIETAVDIAALDGIVAQLKANGIKAVAVCLLNSYKNNEHEKQIADALAKLIPEIHIVISSQISREWREYERTSSTALAAYVKPVAASYLSRLEDGLSEQGFNGSLYVMKSNCGVDTVEAAKAVPISMVESGPASGILGAAEVGRIIGEENILALDIGGTTAKCSLIINGQLPVTSNYYIERDLTSAGYPLMVPVVDLVEIGNGGGSIAWLDQFGKLNVGPQSAGSSPGPAAYGRGGKVPTTTDANLVLGRINPDYFCGGSIKADMASVNTAMQSISDELDISSQALARGIIQIANNNMVNALKLVSVNKGHDPRDFTLVAFGGGGAMHACALAHELGMKKVVIPATASVFSAWGMLVSDLRRDQFITWLSDWDDAASNQIQSQISSLTNEISQAFEDDELDTSTLHTRVFGRFRYQNQEHAIEVPIILPISSENIAQTEALFHQMYEQEYGYQLDSRIELIGLHISAQMDVGKVMLQPSINTGRSLSEAIKGERQVDYLEQGMHKATIFDGELLEGGMQFNGPAIIEESGTTIVIHPKQKVEIDPYRNVIVHLNGEPQ